MISDTDNIRLISSDSNTLDMSAKAAQKSKLLNDLIQDFPNSEIPLNIVKYNTLIKVKEYLEHYKDIEPKEIIYPLPNKSFEECVDDWDYHFIDLDNNEMIFDIMKAANFMDINSLLDLTCAKIASLLKGKDEEQIRNIFNIKDTEDINKNENIEEF